MPMPNLQYIHYVMMKYQYLLAVHQLRLRLVLILKNVKASKDQNYSLQFNFRFIQQNKVIEVKKCPSPVAIFILEVLNNNNNNLFIYLLKKAFQRNLQCQISKTQFSKNTLKTSDRLKPVIPQLLASEGKRALTCSCPTELYMQSVPIPSVAVVHFQSGFKLLTKNG